MSSPALSISTFLFSQILRWYPPALRAAYGDDMIDVFSESVETAWRRASWRGIARAWLAVTDDLTKIVLPYRAARAVPVALAIVSSMIFYGSMLAAIDPSRHCHR